jgi:hypothetical protein
MQQGVAARVRDWDKSERSGDQNSTNQDKSRARGAYRKKESALPGGSLAAGSPLARPPPDQMGVGSGGGERRGILAVPAARV